MKKAKTGRAHVEVLKRRIDELSTQKTDLLTETSRLRGERDDVRKELHNARSLLDAILRGIDRVLERSRRPTDWS